MISRYILLILVVSLWSCSEFLSEEIEDAVIRINSPSDSLYTNSSTLTFWWDSDADIESYRFQLANPSLSNPISLLDTLLFEDRISLILDQGSYEWRVRGENADSKSTYVGGFFVKDSIPPATPNLVSPTAGDTLSLSEATLPFNWTSGDRLIDGRQFPITDSVLIFRFIGQESSLVSSFQGTAPQDLKSTLSSIFPGGIVEYGWQIRSTDQAGNGSSSEIQSFFLRM
ncbi:MAG: hypothetical protein AAF388_11850 [Bacteroidota bacterium]